MGDSCSSNEDENDIEEEGVHPGAVRNHWVEFAAAGEDLGEFDVAFLDGPDEVEDEVGVEEGGDETCVVVVHVD